MTQRTILAAAFSAAALVLAAAAMAAGPATFDVDVDKPGVAVPPTFYGLMTEEINHAYDGGLYAELVQNRTFQDDGHDVAVHWSLVGGAGTAAQLSLDRRDPVNAALPVSLRLDLAGGTAPAGAANDGFWGIPVRPDTTYTASFYAKGGGGFAGPVTAAIVGNDRTVYAHADTAAVTGGWQKYTLTLATGPDVTPTKDARFVVSAAGTGSVSFSLVSLFPPTYERHANGLRPDLMELMAGLHPSFIRLPGGNYVEGYAMKARFNWKQMIGPVARRPGHGGCWGYRSSDGFGLPESLLWCRQLHAEPVLAVFAGYTLDGDYVPAGPKLQPFVDEALQEIEYVTGPADSEWGRRRAADGFRESFKLHYLEVGNEDFFDRSGSYGGRYAQFYDAIKARYPDLQIIATTPVKGHKVDMVDDHYYQTARQMVGLAGHYDRLPRTGPQVFVGEWAAQEGRPTPDLNAGLADAAFVMGLERDADLVRMECYAPLLVNVNPGASQWPTNLIGYDALHSFGSPSYYAQAMIAQNRGDVVLPAELHVPPQPAEALPPAHGAVGVGTWHTDVEYKDMVVTHGERALLRADLTQTPAGWTFTGGKWDLRDAAIKPTLADATAWATTGDPAWTDYTLRLKARKVGGKEGFLILYHVVDGEHYDWVNLGGWGNTKTQCERTDAGGHEAFGPASPFTVNAGQWYDVRLDVAGHRARCFVDGQPVLDAAEPPGGSRTPLVANASYATATREVIVKVVNLSESPVVTTVNLRGAASVAAAARAVVLSGEPTDQNTVTEPTKVAPQEEAVTDAAATFDRTFPPHSLTVLRVAATPR